MASVPLLGGYVANAAAEFVASPPVNLEPVVFDAPTGISEGQLRAMAGARLIATGQGVGRGGVLWNGAHYRASGTKLVKVAGSTVTVVGEIGGSDRVTFDYGFDRLAIRSGTKLFYLTGGGLVEVTDEDLGAVLDMIWADGYFMTTDGTSIVVTDISDPMSVHPRRYGSAEKDPDMIVGLLRFREEIYALGRHTVQVFRNVGGLGFPFQTVPGATIPYGCVSASAKCLFAESFAFVGSARDEALGVYVASDGTAVKISDKALDSKLAATVDPTAIELEARTYGDERRLLVHFSDETWVYHWKASRKAGRSVWCIASTNGIYRLRNAIWDGGRFVVDDPLSANIGVLDETRSDHFGEAVEWRFDTPLLYAEAKGAIIHSLELTGLPGRGGGEASTAFLSYTRDGETWSGERAAVQGRSGARGHRLAWRPHARMRNYLGLRFRGHGLALPGFAALEFEGEALSV